MSQFICTHCQHCFEFERAEGAICPSCGWSSSVVSASELKDKTDKPAKTKNVANPFDWIWGFLRFLLKVAAIVAVILFLIWGVTRLWHSRLTQKSTNKKSESVKLNIAPPQSVVPTALTADDEALLRSKLELTSEAQDEDIKVLQYATDLTAGNVEKLPSSSWKIEEFKEFIEKQEKIFRMPLPRSYKKKLEELFQQTYAGAYDLFLAGNILAARNAYVASLEFPVYANDARKHRAVILTMLRGFVNDTIAKVGALNFTLARQSVSGVAAQVASEYETLQQQIRASQWNEALTAIQKIETLLPAAGVTPLLQASPYPVGFEKIDRDIQPVLLKLLQVPSWVFDLNELKGDLSAKKMLLLKWTDPERKTSLENYNQALEKIQAKAWGEAVAFLNEVKSPLELRKDADLKRSLIEKMTGKPSGPDA